MKFRKHIEALSIIVVLVIVVAAFWMNRSRIGAEAVGGRSSNSSPNLAEPSIAPHGILPNAGAIDLGQLLPAGEGIKTIQNVPISIDGLGLNKRGAQIVIVHYWATWCAPCVTEIPSLGALAKHLGKKAIILAISGDSSLKEIEVFLKSFKEMSADNIKIIHDADQKLRNKMGVNRLPETYIFGKSGVLIKKISGSEKWDSPDAKEYFDMLLKKQNGSN